MKSSDREELHTSCAIRLVLDQYVQRVVTESNLPTQTEPDLRVRKYWIETSSPDLKGQSGGPLFDENGLICGIQVNTYLYLLDFYGIGSNQSLNVGRAVRSDTIIAFLMNLE